MRSNKKNLDNIRSKKYYHTHKEERKAYSKKYRYTHKEECKAYSRKCYHIHKEERKANNRKYYYAHKEEYRMCDKKYYQTHKEEIKNYSKNWLALHPQYDSAKQALRNRNYGYKMLNICFSNSVGHHVNDQDVVFIPEKIHLSCYAGSDKKLHRDRVMKYYGNLKNMINGSLKEIGVY